MDQVRRRMLLAASGAILLAPLASLAQQPGRVQRIRFLISETLQGQKSRVEALRAGLRDFGYVEGKSVAIELRLADGDYARLPALAAELVRLDVDVLVAFGAKAVVAAKGATTTIPIVVPSAGDPVALGVVGGLSRPGGNVTGIAMFGPEISAKQLELLKEAVPRIARVGVLRNPANRGRSASDALSATAKSLKLELQSVDVRSPEEFRGEKLAPDHLPQEQSQVPGHIAGASNIPWAQAANDDGTFKSADELRALYAAQGITQDREVIAYCRIGERSSHTWFALHELLGFPAVKNYDGSWTEYGSLVAVPVERG